MLGEAIVIIRPGCQRAYLSFVILHSLLVRVFIYYIYYWNSEFIRNGWVFLTWNENINNSDIESWRVMDLLCYWIKDT
jgi:hypothetical protein